MPLFLFCILSLIWGSSFIIMKYCGHVFGPAAIGSYRNLFGFFFLLIVYLFSPKKDKISKRKIPLIIVISLFGYALPFWLQPLLISRLNNSAFIGSMVVFVPIFTILISLPLLHKKPTKRELIGVAAGLLLLLFIMWEGIKKDISLLNLMLAMITPMVYAFTNTFMKKYFQKVDPVLFSCIALGIASIVTLPFCYEQVDVQHAFFPKALLLMMVLGFICTGLGNAIFLYLIKKKGPLFASLVGYNIPIVALLWGLGDKEDISVIQVVCLLAIIVIVFFVQTEKKAIE